MQVYDLRLPRHATPRQATTRHDTRIPFLLGQIMLVYVRPSPPEWRRLARSWLSQLIGLEQNFRLSIPSTLASTTTILPRRHALCGTARRTVATATNPVVIIMVWKWLLQNNPCSVGLSFARRAAAATFTSVSFVYVVFDDMTCARYGPAAARRCAAAVYSRPQPILPILVRTAGERHFGNDDDNNKTTIHDNQQQHEMIISSSTEQPLFAVALFLPQ
jgi:hypothetical protein